MNTTTVGMSRVWRACGIAALAFAVAAAYAQAGFVDRFKAATKAHEAKDYARMETELREALKLRPAHPTATYKLAAALALRGDHEGALDTLEQLADMGLYFDPGADNDFASLKGQRGFKSVRRDLNSNRESRGSPRRAFRLKSPTFIPEGIAYDPDTSYFYVGSVHERRIQRIRRDDSEDDFVKPGEGGLWSALGMAVDPEHGLLWVATSALPETRGVTPAELGRTALLAYDLESGKPKHRFELEGTGPRSLGDVTVLDDGTVYATDSRGGMLYSLDPKAGKFVPMTAPGALSSPQGMALARHERGLYVADYTQGLYYFDLKKKELSRVEASRDISLYGIDGLVRYEDTLIAIQNGIRPHRVVRLRVDNRGKKVSRLTVLAASLEEFDEPTLGVVVNRELYFVANSQWGRFDAQHKLPPNDQLRRPLVLRLDLQEEPLPAQRTAPPQTAPQPGGGLPCVPPLC